MNEDLVLQPQKFHHFIDVAEPGDRRDVYAVMTIYWETDPIHAVGQVWSMSRTADKGVTGTTVLNTNDGLSSLWASPEGNLWVGSVWGRVWSTVRMSWDSTEIRDLQWGETDPHFKWKVTELPRGPRGGGLNVAAIWGSSDNDVYAGTFEGAILHWNGAQWGFSHPENKKSIVRMHGTGSRDIWAVGRDGLVLHFDGREWHSVALPGDADQNGTLTGVWSRSDEQVCICSTSGAIFGGSSRGLERIGEYPYSFYGVVEFGGDMYLAAGEGGICLLRGNCVEQVKDTFAATGVYRLRDRLAFVEPVQKKPRVIVFDPAHVRPWTGWLG